MEKNANSRKNVNNKNCQKIEINFKKNNNNDVTLFFNGEFPPFINIIRVININKRFLIYFNYLYIYKTDLVLQWI